MNLSVLCVTNNKYGDAGKFILALHTFCTQTGAELVLGLDREKAQRAAWRNLANIALNLEADKLQEDVLDQAVAACTRDWIFRIDDDETISPALAEWLGHRYYQALGYDLYAFPRVHFWPDEHHIISNDGVYPDLQTRLGRKNKMYGVNHVHAGNPNGTGAVVPYALEHHKLICRTLEQRKEIAAHYESIRPGAGTRLEYARSNWPEQFFDLQTMEYTNHGDFSAH
jgi:hypothetical protein